VSFDGIARCYRSLEKIAFGQGLQRCRVAFLDVIDPPRRALILGEGNGKFLCELLRVCPEVEVDCIDASAIMLRLARRRVRNKVPTGETRVRFLHQDILAWVAPSDHYDLLVTHFVLDCFRQQQLADIVAKLAHAATDPATWLIADFCIPTKGIPRMRARLLLAIMYRFFRATASIDATELIDPAPFIRAQSFALKRTMEFQRGALQSQCWQKKDRSKS